MGAWPGAADGTNVDMNSCTHHRLRVTSAANDETLAATTGTQALPRGIVAVAWEPEADDEPMGVTHSSGTITFATDGSYDGWLHVWSRGSSAA